MPSSSAIVGALPLAGRVEEQPVPLKHALRGRYGRVIGATVLCSGALMSVPGAKASFPGDNGLIAFSYGVGRCSTPVIATMKPDGTAIRTLTECDDFLSYSAEYGPDWSRNGRRILFTRVGSSNPREGIAVVNADGSRYRVVIAGSGPSFSPDGKHFTYTRTYAPPVGDGISSEIRVAALDGSEDRMLRLGSLPRWSPNGRLIAYVEPAERAGDIAVRGRGTWLMDPLTGRRVRRIARSSLNVLDWSPDARRLLYLPAHSPSRFGLRVMRANGTGKWRLTPPPGLTELVDAAFSPNGRRIVLSGTRRVGEGEQQHAIWTMTACGRQRRQIFGGERELEEDAYQGAPSLSWQARPDR
jgi:Tol biopolymer transport system component